MDNKKRGRPPLPPEKAKSEFIWIRVTKEQYIEYDRRGGKEWILKLLNKKTSAWTRL